MSTPSAPPRSPSGTRDVLAPESARWEQVVARFAAGVEAAGYGLTLTPVFEYASVFRRGIGDGSDVVGKEMYEFTDRDGQQLALRPEGTASIVRAFVQHHPLIPFKAWYVTPAFRHERAQALRYRQHHQLGIEAIGTPDADLDVEVIALAHDFFAGLGLERVELRVNSMGDGACRPAYLELLAGVLADRVDQLCDEHRARYAANPLRVLDCKKPECRKATADVPRLTDHLCGPCAEHFARVRGGLESNGIAYVVDHRLVRGFDYYTRTTFEFASAALESAQNGIGGGGRYDGLVEMLGGDPAPGIGFGIGIERVLGACDAEEVFVVGAPPLDAFVVDVSDGDGRGSEARDLTIELRRAGLSADRAFDGRSTKSQMKAANRSGAIIAVLIGPEELASGTVTVKPLRSGGEQYAVGRHEAAVAVARELAAYRADLDTAP